MKGLAGLIALLHCYVFFLESFAWEKTRTRRLFGMSEAQAEACRDLAFNQGFYNLFIALGIIAGLIFNETPLVDYGVASVAAAGAVLILRSPKLYRAALIQMGPALAYLISRLLALIAV